MAGDHSRNTFDPLKQYVAVLEQQGRVRTDAEANEQQFIRLYRTEVEARDVIGAVGVPKHDPGFAIGVVPGGGDLTIAPGRIYVNGQLCQQVAETILGDLARDGQDVVALGSVWADGRRWQAGQWAELTEGNSQAAVRVISVDEANGTLSLAGLPGAFPTGPVAVRRITTYLTQPDYPAPPFSALGGGLSSPPANPPTSPPTSPPSGDFLQLPDGDYLAHLCVFKREITALEDRRIREVALGGPDTTTRLQTVCQVGLLPISPSPPVAEPTCDADLAEWGRLIARPTGKMNARTVAASPGDDPCELPPSAGFRRLTNQLYRIVVHRGDDRANATFKWSRDNDTVTTAILSIAGDTLTVADTGKDRLLSFASQQWVEVYDDESELLGQPRALVEIDVVDPDRSEIKLKSSLASLAGRAGLKLRRWDQSGAGAGADGVPMPADWTELEDGVQVRFGDGTYRSGDYWLIPARNAVGDVEWPPYEIPNQHPIPQPPLGIERSYGRLALLRVTNGTIAVTDCRKDFPGLSEICAEDICFDDSICQLNGAETVQQAIDRLCQLRDLRFHNKHLHGKGVVCGLQVQCSSAPPPRRSVVVRPGYAIDCEGRDIVLERPRRLDVAALLTADAPAGSPPTAPREVAIRVELGADGEPAFSAVPAPPPGRILQEVLQGTLLRDLYDQCLEPILAVLRSAFGDDGTTAGGVASGQQKVASSLTTLWAPNAGRGGPSQPWISGSRTQPAPNSEHRVLEQLYQRLLDVMRGRVGSICGLLDNLRPFPDYPFDDTGVGTLHGYGFYGRFDVANDGTRGYAYGNGNKILVYDLEQGTALSEATFPGDSGLQISDLAFSQNGRQVYVVAHADGDDSFLALADVSKQGLEWGRVSTICDAHITAIETIADDQERVFAIGQGSGLYEINPRNVEPRPAPKHRFNATGELVAFPARGYVYATAGSGKASDRYDSVVRIATKAEGDGAQSVFPLQVGETPVSGSDGIALASDDRRSGRLLVTVDGPDDNPGKHALVFNALERNPAKPRHAPVDVALGEDGPVRLAYNAKTDFAMFTSEENHRIGIFQPRTGQLDGFRHPVGVSPRSIAVAADRVWTLNYAANSLTSIEIGRIQPGRQPDTARLIEYRAALAEAFVDLFGALLQHVKDCFCNLLLVDCPTCDGDEKVELARVRLQNGEVIQVCSLSGRDHVHTFPKLGYWFSLIPVLPFVGLLIEKLCCLALPNLFGRFQADRTVPGAESSFTGVDLGGLTQRLSEVAAMDPDRLFLSKTANLDLGRALFDDFLAGARERPKDGTTLAQRDLAGLTVDRARVKLATAGIGALTVEELDPNAPVTNLARLALAPEKVGRGDEVTLVARNGVVRYAKAVAAAPVVSELRRRLETMERVGKETAEELVRSKAGQEDVDRLNERLTSVREHLDDVSATRDQLQNRSVSLEVKLKATRKELTAELKARDKRIAQLEKRARVAESDAKVLKTLRQDVERLKKRRG